MTRAVTLSFVLVAAAAAQSAAHAVGINAVRSAFGVAGPMCPSLTVRLLSSASYFGLLVVFVGVVGVVACRVSRRDLTAARAVVLGAVFGAVLSVALQRLAFQVGAIQAAALTHIAATNAIAAWGSALMVAIGATIGLGDLRGGPTRR